MIEPSDHEKSLFEHYASEGRSKLSEQVAEFDKASAGLRDIMAQIMQGGGGDTIAMAIASLKQQQQEVINQLSFLTDITLIEDNEIFSQADSLIFWTDFVYTHEQSLIEYIEKLCGEKVSEPTSHERLLKRAKAYAGLTNGSDIDPSDKEFIDTASYEEAENDEDAEWVVMALYEKLDEDIDAFLEHVPPNFTETRQAKRDKVRRISKTVGLEALRAVSYVGLSVAAVTFFKRKR